MAEPVLRQATYADLEAVPKHLVAELVGGVVETHPRPHPGHAGAATRLSYELTGPFDRGRGGPGGWIFLVEPELRFGEDVVVPDIAGWRRERLPAEPVEAFITIAPDWVCEILSPSTARLDRGPKRRIYADAGVAHLWLLDPAARLLEGFSLNGRRWLLIATIETGELVSLLPFDVVAFPLSDLFPFDDPEPLPSSPPSSEA